MQICTSTNYDASEPYERFIPTLFFMSALSYDV